MLKRFIAMAGVVSVLIFCFAPAAFADNTVATSTDIYLNAFCNNNADGTVAAPCPVVGGFPLGFKRSDSVSDQVPTITYWNYAAKTRYYRVDLGTIGTGTTNIAFNFRILDELSGAYNNNVADSGHTLTVYSDSGTVPVSDLEWYVKDQMTFTGQSYSTVTFSCKLNPETTAENAYLVFGLYFVEVSIPAIVEIPQYKWSGPVNGFGSTMYDDIDIYANGTDQSYVPVNEAVYMQACYDAYSAASYFSYFGQGIMSQTLDLDIILDAIQEESSIIQKQNDALAASITTSINLHIDATEDSINANIDEAEESLNANIDEESQAIQGAISDQTSDLEGAIQDQTDAVVGGIETQTSDLESYFQPIIDHYNQVEEAGETISNGANQETIAEGSESIDSGIALSGDLLSDYSLFFSSIDESLGYFALLGSCVQLFLNFGIISPVLGVSFIIILGFLGLFLILRVLKE